ncbi:MAG: GNAT family N-acetyltransferase [Acidobacteriaceae bacterium]|nr:GNAT family N-acetyltransferase [Acidobacteriaceae bacterium]
MRIGTLENSTREARLLLADDAADVRLWESLVDTASVPDVYYRPGYVMSYQAIGHGRAAAVLVETGDVRALLPLLLRPLNTLPCSPGEPGYDAATPYGYGGVVLLDGVQRIAVEQARGLLDALRHWCRENQVISAHVRLHPVLRQEQWFAGELSEDCRLHLPARTTAINLECWNPEDACISTLSKGRRSDLSFAQRHLRLTWASDRSAQEHDLRTFYALYEQRMTELQAGEYYHFPFEYYQFLARGLGRKVDVALAWLCDKPVGGSLFMTDRILSHYHLSASNDLGRAHKATTLILNGAVERARQLGCQHLHLGGGVHGEDNLFAFKQSFGGDIYRYAFLALVCNRVRHGNLVQKRVNSPDLPPLRTNFFPEYRA